VLVRTAMRFCLAFVFRTTSCQNTVKLFVSKQQRLCFSVGYHQWRNFGLKSGGQKFWLAFWTLKSEGNRPPTPKSVGTGPPVPPEITPMVTTVCMATDGAGMAHTTAVVPSPILPPTNSSDLRDSHKWSWSWLGGSGPLDPPTQLRPW
jgi:hypothetical protein